MNNIKCAWHSLIRADIVFYTFYTQNIQCLPFDHHQSWPSSMNFTFLKYPQCFPSTYQTHDLIVVSQTETFQRHRLSANKQAMRGKKPQKDKEKREKTHQLSIWRMTSFVPSLSFLSHLLGWTESPLSLSGMTASLKSLETPFSSVSLASPLSLPLSGCYFPETL